MFKYIVLLSLLISSLFAETISSYLYADYKNIDHTISLLESKDFEVVGEYDVMGNENYHIIAFTNKELIAKAKEYNRGFAAVLKVMVSKKNHQLVFTNPEYFLHAFLQEDYDRQMAKVIFLKLQMLFDHLKGSEAKLDADDLAEYHFLMGMPYYSDMIELTSGTNLLEKLEENAEDKVIFSVTLGTSTLVGIEMDGDKGEKSFLSTIGGEYHAAFLPYMVLLENNKAKMLNPKYYIALAYPELTMTDFIKINDTPDDIQAYMSELFK